jgi:hypothetical protein
VNLEPKSPPRVAGIRYRDIDAGRYTASPARNFVRCAVLVAATLLSLPAVGDVLTGIRFGTMMVDLSSTRNPRNLAVYLGYRIDTNLANLSIVGEVNRSVIDGKSRNEGDLEFESDAVFLVLKTTRSMFVSLRGGYVRDRIVTDIRTRSDDGLLLGVGIGGVAGRSRFMIEYTSLAQDGDFLSLGLEF